MEKVHFWTLVNIIIVLLAEEVDVSQCIFLEKKMVGMWKQKQISYTPGRLMVGIRSGANLERLIQIIEKSGGKIDYISKTSIDVLVESRRTLDIASELDSTGEFRFVTPEVHP
jgi:hypothetical protein